MNKTLYLANILHELMCKHKFNENCSLYYSRDSSVWNDLNNFEVKQYRNEAEGMLTRCEGDWEKVNEALRLVFGEDVDQVQ
ncbi:MAG: hypothetical protein UX08_C0016G0011 [Candidatus Collierbacteria bacterium GW2011_GWB1_45_35]|uniref:Uncharacterized protein n=2 Tax=Candidatus Collieribacteriota TaxID=1752725 RepID=A0A0G1NMW8_9BACT|nr:MAG: hypothetical protein UW48_C0006G0008 [Microgenomates group bacterium GW2011_GWC1_44_23]KKT85554.1 MAG: hypothetical protein UW84_C0028G0010 [Candidatus Collierbacteria bacterium GW2011_GWA2_44_99]KKT95981.1 MAG: hypothetical protein UW96_C0002G0008 [Candidatus Collierbacteria bacterium GW2011_GWA1_45_15]KKU01146.1 MAG: hypothetical protein UX01_C0002G0112 [Candidatus Collierbacteria bacterium GW2011_GWB2_45_17]KKU04803.1 MAG: hypothetical protein UX08_C0016G0011 [Candidatus Collierbacte